MPEKGRNSKILGVHTGPPLSFPLPSHLGPVHRLIIKYSRKCSSFYFLIMSQDNTYKICLLIKLDVRDQGQKNNAVSVKVTRSLWIKCTEHDGGYRARRWSIISTTEDTEHDGGVS